MPALPGTPITAVPATVVPNDDLPSDPFASLTRIASTELVNPTVANRQEKALEKRDETLRATVNLLVTAMNAVDTDYMRRDGTTQQDTVAGFEANIPMNSHKFTGMVAGSGAGDSVEYAQFAAEIAARAAGDASLQSQVYLLAPLLSPHFSGTPTAPPIIGGANSQIATAADLAAGSGTAVVQTAFKSDMTGQSTVAHSLTASGYSLALSNPLKSTSSKVRIRVTLPLYLESFVSGGVSISASLSRGGTDLTPGGANGMACVNDTSGATQNQTLEWQWVDSPGSTTPATYNVTWYVGSNVQANCGANMVSGFKFPCVITLEELVN